MVNRNIEFGRMQLQAMETARAPRPPQRSYAKWQRNETKAAERREIYRRERGN
jgi:hypothetical protein